MKHCVYCDTELYHQGNAILDDWWSCSQCKIFVCYHITTDFLNEVRFEAVMPQGRYVLCLRYIAMETRFFKIPSKPNDTMIDIFTIPEIVQGITPHNIKDKIKTYLVFS